MAEPRRARIMGVLNVTPDSFSDGGRFDAPDRAVAQAVRMAGEGADIVDVGGESTRPGHVPIAADEEIRRVVPVIAALADRLAVPVSIDTNKAEVAEAAIAAGARIVNDVWGFQRDPRLADVTAAHGLPCVLMHNREAADAGIDIVDDVCRFFDRSLAIAGRAGVRQGRIVLDPGVGFGKTFEQNLVVIRAAARLRERFGLPLLYGVSRKSFIGRILERPDTDERLFGTLAVGSMLLAEGVEYLRVHDVRPHLDAARMAAALGHRPAGADPLCATGEDGDG